MVLIRRVLDLVEGHHRAQPLAHAEDVQPPRFLTLLELAAKAVQAGSRRIRQTQASLLQSSISSYRRRRSGVSGFSCGTSIAKDRWRSLREQQTSILGFRRPNGLPKFAMALAVDFSCHTWRRTCMPSMVNSRRCLLLPSRPRTSRQQRPVGLQIKLLEGGEGLASDMDALEAEPLDDPGASGSCRY